MNSASATLSPPIILPHKGVYPTIAPDAYIAPGAVIVGDVHIGEKSSIWFGCIIRGDVNHIRIGNGSNIQDGTIIHVTQGGAPTLIGNHVTVAHNAMLHACTLEDHSFVGMRAFVMDNAVVETEAAVAAGAMITEGKRVGSGQLWMGWPAKFCRDMSEAEKMKLCHSLATNYVGYSRDAIQDLEDAKAHIRH